MPRCRKRSRRSRLLASSVRILSICDTIRLSLVRRHFVPDLWINDVSRSAEVDDHRYGTAGESLKDHTGAVVLEAGNTNTSADRNLAEDFLDG